MQVITLSAFTSAPVPQITDSVLVNPYPLRSYRAGLDLAMHGGDQS